MSPRRSRGVSLTGDGIIVDENIQNPPTRCATRVPATRVHMYVHKTYDNERYRAKPDDPTYARYRPRGSLNRSSKSAHRRRKTASKSTGFMTYGLVGNI